MPDARSLQPNRREAVVILSPALMSFAYEDFIPFLSDVYCLLPVPRLGPAQDLFCEWINPIIPAFHCSIIPQ
jgi:hypothetical protein